MTSEQYASVRPVLRRLSQSCEGEQQTAEFHKKIEDALRQLELEVTFLPGHKGESQVVKWEDMHLPIILKPRAFMQACREELVYKISEKLGFHLVPPTVAKGNAIAQLWLVNFIEEGAYPAWVRQSRGICLPPAGKVFYYIVNEYPDDSARRLWHTIEHTGQKVVMLINHADAFSLKSPPIFDNAIESINMDEVFTQKKWERFLSISAAQWEVLLDSLPALLTEEEKTGFLQRINHVKQAVFRQIEKNKSHLLPVIDMAGEQGKNIRALLGEYGLSLPSDIAFLPKSALGELETLHRRFQRLSSVVPPNSPASSSNSSRQAHPRSRRAQWLTACLPCIPPRGADPSASPPPSKISVHLRERHVSFGETWKRQALIATAMGMSEVLRKYSIRPDAGNSDEKSADAAV